MKNFVIFIVLIFGGLFATLVLKKNSGAPTDSRTAVKIYASSSFIAQWGPGPKLKELFEKECDCRVEYREAADSNILIQRLKSEGRASGADVVLGFDQFDLDQAQQGLEWKKIHLNEFEFEDSIKSYSTKSPLVPYDWSLLSFVVRKSDFKDLPKNLNDLMNPDLKGQISMEDPRTSSPGMQFLLWLIHIKGEEKAFQFLREFNTQVHSYAPSWSTAYGLFQKTTTKMVYSYVTSPIYHLVEDKSSDYAALEMEEGSPLQVEFAGVPATCHNCDLGEKFVQFMLSRQAQKVIMEKNYMFPAISGVRPGTPFNEVPNFKISEMTVIPNQSDRERIQKKWANMRRGD